MHVRAATQSTRGVILAGQYAWKDSKFDSLCPRPLLPVANQPLVSYALLWLHEGGLRDVTVCANRNTRAVGARLQEYVPPDLDFDLLEDPVPRGPGGCVRDAAGDAETLVVVGGTTIPLLDLDELLASHRASGAALTVVVHPEPSGDGVPRRHVPAGIYDVERRALEHIPTRGFFDIKESLIPRLYRAGQGTTAFPAREWSPRVLDASSYLALNAWMVERLCDAPPAEGFVRVAGVLAHESARIADDVACVGPVLVGAGAQVMPGATIVGPTSIGGGSIVAEGALVSRSAVWSRCVVGEGTATDGCILADGAAIEPGGRAFGTVQTPEPRRRPAVFPTGRTQPGPAYRVRPHAGPALSSTD
jgi:NDP-sugar pyrophosphorylase family protein